MSIERKSNSIISPYCYPGLFTQAQLQTMFDDKELKNFDIKTIILNTVKTKIKIDYKVLCGKPTKKRDFVIPRFWYILFLKKYTTLTLKSIGNIFGIECHSTIKNAIKKN